MASFAASTGQPPTNNNLGRFLQVSTALIHFCHILVASNFKNLLREFSHHSLYFSALMVFCVFDIDIPPLRIKFLTVLNLNYSVLDFVTCLSALSRYAQSELAFLYFFAFLFLLTQ